MNDLKSITAGAGQLLQNSALGRLPHLVSAWNAMDWRTANQDTGADAEVNLADPRVVTVYPQLLKKSALWQQACLLREFGISVYKRHAGDLAKRTWEEKLCLPEAEQVAAVQSKLKLPDYTTYLELVESFERCMDRYVALNICNGLLRPLKTSREDARNLNIYDWSTTKEYASLRRSHRVVPFVYAYGTRQVAECPGCGLAELVANQLGVVRESSVAKAFGQVIQETFSLCR